MALDIYEPRGYNHIRGINPEFSFCVSEQARWRYSGNLVVLDTDVARKPSISGAINDTSTQDHDIKCLSGLL